MDDEPLSNSEARALIRSILKEDGVSLSKHAREELANDGLEQADALNVLRGGWVEYCEQVRGTWRYRVTTHTICVVIAFRSRTRLGIVTAWRK